MSELGRLISLAHAGNMDDADEADRRRAWVARFTDGYQTRSASTSAGSRIPTAEVVHVEQRPRTRVVIVRCPFADAHLSKRRGHEFHTHGWPNGDERPGTRVPHCDRDPGELYELTITPATTRG